VCDRSVFASDQLRQQVSQSLLESVNIVDSRLTHTLLRMQLSCLMPVCCLLQLINDQTVICYVFESWLN